MTLVSEGTLMLATVRNANGESTHLELVFEYQTCMVDEDGQFEGNVHVSLPIKPEDRKTFEENLQDGQKVSITVKFG